MSVDLVCGMEFDEKTSDYFCDFQGRRFHFCGKKCKEEFINNPQKFVQIEKKVKK